MKFAEYKGLDLPGISKTVLQDWKDKEVFQKSVDQREGQPSYVFFEGPPSANGLPGIHHAMARTIKDIFPRYKTMKGFQVKRKAGWDTHGLPIELGVEKALGITKEDIGTKISVEEYNKACRAAVMRYTDVWNDMTDKVGYWVDMEDPYITYEPKYMESVWWLLKEIYNKGLIYKGYTIQPYSPKAGTGLSSHELNQPGTYQDVTDTTVTAQFKAKEETLPKALQGLDAPLYFLAWTTTPWTLPSNTALTVGPKIEYVLVRSFNQYTFEPMNVLLAKALVGKQFSGKYQAVDTLEAIQQYSKEDKKIPYLVVSSLKGTDLIGAKYEQLMTGVLPCDHPENAFRIIGGGYRYCTYSAYFWCRRRLGSQASDPRNTAHVGLRLRRK
jgi:isoleucyl-tRNA synthetase